MKRKILSILLVVCVMAQLMTGLNFTAAAATNDPNFSGGDGLTRETALIITNQTQLQKLNDTNYIGKKLYFKLGESFSINSYFTPIGTNTVSKQFVGYFDGDDKTITINSTISSATYAGIFGYTNGAEIKNLNLYSILSSAISISDTSGYAGSIVGYAQGTLDLIKCNSTLNVNGKSYTGGLVGYGNDVNIKNCSFSGKVSGTSYVGGIAGKAYKGSNSSTAQIYQSSVMGTVEGTSSNVGGIVGQLTGEVIQSYCTANVSGTTLVGGIAGDLYYTSKITSLISDCYSTGSITATSSSGRVGGIVGDATGYSGYPHTIEKCYSAGTITGGANTGGIAGYVGATTTYSKVKNCVALSSLVTQKGAVSTVGRVYGNDNTSAASNSDNKVSDGMRVYYSNGTELKDFSKSKHGTTINATITKTAGAYPGWDFVSTWYINPNGTEYPILRWTYDPASVSIVGRNEFEVTSFPVIETYTAKMTNAKDSVKDWSITGDTSVATIVNKGNTADVTFKKEGAVTINVTTTLNVNASMQVTAKQKLPTLPTLEQLGIGLEVGEKCSVAGLLSDKSMADRLHLTWKSSSETVAVVDKYGRVTAKSTGTAIITATDAGAKSASIYVTVYDALPVYVEEIIISPETINLNTLEQFTPAATILPADATDKTLVWSCDNENVAFVNSVTGKITTAGPGEANVYAKSANGIEGVIHVVVTQPVESVTIEAPEVTEIIVGQTLQLSALVDPEDASSQKITWSCSPSEAASIDENGLLTALAPEKALTITATADGAASEPVIIKILSGLLETYELANWQKVIFDYNALKYYPSVSILSSTPYISGENLTDYEMAGTNLIRTKGWDKSTADNTKAFLVTIPGEGYSNFTVRYEQKANDNSPNEFTLEYRIGDDPNGEWIKLTEYRVREIGQPATDIKVIENIVIEEGPVNDNLYLRVRAGTRNYSGSNVGAAAYGFIQNLVITGQR